MVGGDDEVSQQWWQVPWFRVGSGNGRFNAGGPIPNRGAVLAITRTG